MTNEKIFILDACALIAFLDEEEGSSKVEEILNNAEKKECLVFMNKINLLEVYYEVYRKQGKVEADNLIKVISSSPIKINNYFGTKIFKEAGRLKGTFKISLADSMALAEAKVKNAKLVTADHHEFDMLEEKKELDFFWIR